MPYLRTSASSFACRCRYCKFLHPPAVTVPNAPPLLHCAHLLLMASHPPACHCQCQYLPLLSATPNAGWSPLYDVLFSTMLDRRRCIGCHCCACPSPRPSPSANMSPCRSAHRLSLSAVGPLFAMPDPSWSVAGPLFATHIPCTRTHRLCARLSSTCARCCTNLPASICYAYVPAYPLTTCACPLATYAHWSSLA